MFLLLIISRLTLQVSMFEHFEVYKYSYLDDKQKESHVIVDMKKAVRATKKNNSNPRPHANKKVMNFDF